MRTAIKNPTGIEPYTAPSIAMPVRFPTCVIAPGHAFAAKDIEQLRKELSVPHTLKDLGVADDRIDMLAEMATADPSAGTNPIPVGVKEHRTLLEMSFTGRIA